MAIINSLKFLQVLFQDCGEATLAPLVDFVPVGRTVETEAKVGRRCKDKYWRARLKQTQAAEIAEACLCAGSNPTAV